MRRLTAPVLLACARARRSRSRWLWPAIGLAVTIACGGALATEVAIAGDQAARQTLGALAPLDRTLRVTWDGPVTAAASREATAVLARLGARRITRVALLDPVRLSGTVVRPAAIFPLSPWLAGDRSAVLGRCRAQRCPVLFAGGGRVPTALRAAGVRLQVVGRGRLDSNVPLGFTAVGDGPWPLVLTGDVAGLDHLAGLSGLFRVRSWVALLPTAGLHSWELASIDARLLAAQAQLLDFSQQFSLSAPFSGIAEARAQAGSAPARLELIGGGAVVIVGLFVLLGAAALRPQQRAELERLALAGATSSQMLVFVVAEAALLSAAGSVAGAAGSVLAALALSGLAQESATAVLAQSLLTPGAVLVLLGAWLLATAVLSCAALPPRRELLAAAAVAGALALAAAAALGPSVGGAWPALAPPIWCVAAGAVIFCLTGPLLTVLERTARRGPPIMRLAIVGLARNRGLSGFSVAFVAIGVGLGGFALSFRATLARGDADQAAARVPLDLTVAPGPDFAAPLAVAPLARWRTLADGVVLPVRRTDATYASTAGSVTEPALGVPAAGLTLMHGWRRSDASAPLGELARRLLPPGPLRTPGPSLPAAATRLTVIVRSPAIAVTVVADLLGPLGDLRQIELGSPGPGGARLSAAVPRGHWQLEALEIDESAGLEATNGHQNAENPAATTQEVESIRVGPLQWTAGPGSHAGGRRSGLLAMGGWRGVGALAAGARPSGRTGGSFRFDASGFPGVLRPAQPSDRWAVPILADPQTAASAGRDGRLALTVDGLPVSARVVGVLRRFPTVGPGNAGFVVADQGVLAAALDAQLPGQGRPDELWIDSRRPQRLRAALRAATFRRLDVQFREDVERGLTAAAVSRAVAATLLVGAGIAAILAGAGLMLVLLGPLRDRRIEEDLSAQGVGPRAVRSELVARLAVAATLGSAPGAALAVGLSALFVTRGGLAAQSGAWPPLVAVVPVTEIVAWAVAVAALPVLAGSGTVSRR